MQEVTEAKLNNVVSGALDRLHAQADPCVRFDSEQKLWIYLHRRRNEDNFRKLFSTCTIIKSSSFNIIF